MAKKLKVLSAKKLGLTQAEWLAGRWVRKQLKREAFLHAGNEGNVLSMITTCELLIDPEDNHKCGTKACIGGWWAIKLLGYKPNEKGLYTVNTAATAARMIKLQSRSRALYNLFYEFLGDPHPAASVQALDNFFAGYFNPWYFKNLVY